MIYRAIVFDLFGTLIDNFTHSSLARSMQRMAEAVGAPVEAFREGWLGTYVARNTGAYASPEANIREVCTHLGVTPTPEGVAEAARLRLAYTRSYLVPRDDGIETLTAIKESGRKLALVSDCSIEVPTLWGETPFAPLFDIIIFSCQMKTKKPDPRMYLAACEGLGVPPAACMYVGDGSSHELTGAAAVGMSPVLIRMPHEDDPDSYRPLEDAWEGPMVQALGEVLALLK